MRCSRNRTHTSAGKKTAAPELPTKQSLNEELLSLTRDASDVLVLSDHAASPPASTAPSVFLHTLILPHAFSTVHSVTIGQAEKSTRSPQTWLGACVVRVRMEDEPLKTPSRETVARKRGREAAEGSSYDTMCTRTMATPTVTVVLAPACLRLFPFRLPHLPAHLQALVESAGRFASLNEAGFGHWDVGMAISGAVGSAEERSGLYGVVFLGYAAAPRVAVEAISGSFPLFRAPHRPAAGCSQDRECGAGEGLFPVVLGPGECDSMERQALMRSHWQRLQAMLPAKVLPRLLGEQTVDSVLAEATWYLVRFPDGDPFPENEERLGSNHAESEGSTATKTPVQTSSRFTTVTVRADAAHAAHGGGVPSAQKSPSATTEVMVFEKPYYLLPEFLLFRHIAVEVGLQSMEPQRRTEARKAAHAVKGVLEQQNQRQPGHGSSSVWFPEATECCHPQQPSHCGHKTEAARLIIRCTVEEEEVTRGVGMHALLQRASALS